MPSLGSRVAAGCLLATLAFWAYTQTLLPGVDAGDTGGFQAAVLWPEQTARQAYPLYYTLSRPFVRAASADDPARGLNLVSAILGAVAVGLLTALGALLTRSLWAGALAGLLAAFSYTFWTQAIIAEVYTLHLALVAGCLLALHVYATTPTTARLALLCAIYAASFGNHLSMILLLPPLAAFVVWVTPKRRELFTPRTIALVLAIAAAGALQYLPLVLSVWQSPDAPPGAVNRLAAFWFDVTKADWRETMVLGVLSTQSTERLAMWWFDLRQQFGVAGVVLALLGTAVLARTNRPWALTLGGIWIMFTAFALSYNVGDAHVFFLPAHFVMALLAGAVLSATMRPIVATGAITLTLLYGGWRAWDTWPAVDRHDDRRAQRVITTLTLDLDAGQSLLVTNLDWQIENVLLYYTRTQRVDLPWLRLHDVFTAFPRVVQEAHARGKDVLLTSDAARDVASAFGPAYPAVPDARLTATSVADAVAQMPRGTPYVLSLLTPPRDQPIEPGAFARTVGELTGGHAPALDTLPYLVIAGLSGEAPTYARASRRPFRESFRVLDEPFTVRMESWLGTDTFRRAGFGHVLRGRDHVLIIERGISLVWIRPDGSGSLPVYGASLFADRPRFRIPASRTRLAWSVPAEP